MGHTLFTGLSISRKTNTRVPSIISASVGLTTTGLKDDSNVKVVWTNGHNVDTAPRDNNSAPAPAPAAAEDDLPF